MRFYFCLTVILAAVLSGCGGDFSLSIGDEDGPEFPVIEIDSTHIIDRSPHNHTKAHFFTPPGRKDMTCLYLTSGEKFSSPECYKKSAATSLGSDF
jgi:hypothetical protein